MKTIIEEAGKDFVGSNLDTGNPMFLLEDPLLMLEVLGPYVATTHIRDSVLYEHSRGAAFQWVALGDGTMDFPRILALFKQVSARGYATRDHHGPCAAGAIIYPGLLTVKNAGVQPGADMKVTGRSNGCGRLECSQPGEAGLPQRGRIQMTSKALLRYSLPLILSTSPHCVIDSASAAVIFKADFETGDLSQWSKTGTRSQNATPRNVQVVTDVVQEGKYAGKFTIHEDDLFNAQQLRVQVGGPKVTVEEGSDTYMSFYIYMAEAPKDRDNFFYWEGTPPPKFDNVMTWWVQPEEGGRTVIKYGTGNLGRNGTHWEADFTIGRWHQLAMHIHWSEDPDKGNTRLWFDGVLVLDKKLKTKGPEAVYFCQPGIHRSPRRPSVDTIYFDNFILADTLEEVVKEVPKPAEGAGKSPAK